MRWLVKTTINITLSSPLKIGMDGEPGTPSARLVEKRQDASTKDLIFEIPTLIETLSAGITLYPGDIIANGTPVGVGIGFKPPKYLKAGDRVRVETDGIGALENPVR